MTKLSVNVNKLATLRNSREKNLPDLVEFGRDILAWGVHGLTVHPRPDGRHIRRHDVLALSAVVREFNACHKSSCEFNIEGYPSHDYLALIKETTPTQATLVPDQPEALTSNAGWNVAREEKFLRAVVQELKTDSVRVSVFVDPAELSEQDLKTLKSIGVDRIELYTEKYSDDYSTPHNSETLKRYVTCAQQAHRAGLGINAGHDLNQKNLGALIAAIPEIDEVSIGHALICESLREGMETTVKKYLRILGWAK